MKRRSQSQIVCDYLATGKPLTTLQAIHKWTITRLAARVNDLRRAGHNIRAERVKRNGSTFCRYRLVR